MSNDKANVIILSGIENLLEKHEVDAAWILARHYNAVIEFLRRVDGYKISTPDIVMNGVLWEIKSPEGKSKKNIERQVKRALKQSRNIIIDGRRSGSDDVSIENKLRKEVEAHTSIRRLVYITKTEKVLEIVWK
jgi:hypothetical protein